MTAGRKRIRMRCAGKIGRWLLGLLAAIALAVFVGTLVPRPLLPVPNGNGVGDRHILVLSNPIHTDIAIPIDESVRATFAFLGEAGMPIDAPGAHYLIFGWGSRAFYVATPTWADLKPGPLLRGLTFDRSAIHVDVTGMIVEPHPAVRRYDIGADRFADLLSIVRASFAAGPDGAPAMIAGAGYGDYDRFYEADGMFTALLGCNTWTARVLRSAGLRTGWWNPLPSTLDWSLALHNRDAGAAGR